MIPHAAAQKAFFDPYWHDSGHNFIMHRCTFGISIISENSAGECFSPESDIDHISRLNGFTIPFFDRLNKYGVGRQFCIDTMLVQILLHTGGSIQPVSFDSQRICIVHIHIGQTVVGEYIQYFQMSRDDIPFGYIRWYLYEQATGQQGICFLDHDYAISFVQKLEDFTCFIGGKYTRHHFFIFGYTIIGAFNEGVVDKFLNIELEDMPNLHSRILGVLVKNVKYQPALGSVPL